MTTPGDHAITGSLTLETILMRTITVSSWSRTRSDRRGRHARPRRWHRWF